MAEIRGNRAERWRGNFSLVSTDPDGIVRWPPKWTAVEKRKYLEHKRQSAQELDPGSDPNSGSLAILAKAVEEAEAEERRA